MHFGDSMPFLLIIFSLLCAFISPIFARWKRKVCPYLAIFSIAISFLNSCALAYRVAGGEIIRYHVSDWPPPWGIEICIDELSAMMLRLLSGCCLLISIYSIKMLPREIPSRSTGWYYTVYILTLTSMMGMVITNDLFNLYVMVEVTQIGACGLVAAKGEKLSTEAALRYLMLASGGPVFCFWDRFSLPDYGKTIFLMLPPNWLLSGLQYHDVGYAGLSYCGAGH